MLYQVEITTFCNLKCFYCPIETIKNSHMEFNLFCKIVDSFKSKSIIRLQGTGEPFLHPNFYEMLLYVKRKGHYTDVITNGTIKIESKYIKLLDSIGFSIDTLNMKESKKSKRDKLKITLHNLFHVYKNCSKKVKIFAVNYGQDLKALKKFSKNYYIPLTIQNIQTKTSYQSKYKLIRKNYKNFFCRFIDEDIMNFYFVDGTIAPCCFMVNKSLVKKRKEIKEMLNRKIVPTCCEQCIELIERI